MNIAARYLNNLGPDIWDGLIGDVPISWTDSARIMLPEDAANQKSDMATMKALSEHYLHEIAVEQGYKAAVIR